MASHRYATRRARPSAGGTGAFGAGPATGAQPVQALRDHLGRLSGDTYGPAGGLVGDPAGAAESGTAA